MAFEDRPYPEFSWSISRQRTLDDCPRAYFYKYYLSHNGWTDGASADARTAYRLKQLTTLDQLLGLQIDERGRELESAARAGESPPSQEVLMDRTLAALRVVWRESLAGRDRFEARPKSVRMLRAMYLEQDTQPEVDRLNQKVGPCMEGLLAVTHWARLRECGSAGKVVIPDFASFTLDGLRVFAAPDLAYVHDGTVHVIDWKSGRQDASNEMQVLLQAHYVLESDPSFAGLNLRGHIEYVGSGASERIDPDVDFRVRNAETVRQGVAEMRALVSDPERNVPLEMEAFEKRESGLCRTCNFSSICD